jgi:CBS-domain-containing membrane protein
LPVIDNEGKFLGWVDRVNVGKGEMVRDIINRSVATATANAVLSEALSLMLSSGFKTLAIVDGINKLEGVLSFDAIQLALSEVAQRRGSE